MIKKIYFIILVSILTAGSVSAQTVDVHFNGMGFFDNREYKEFVHARAPTRVHVWRLM
jgi:hypothetical protein